MPLYCLFCPKCGWTQDEVLLSIKEDPANLSCGLCHKKGLVKKPCRVHARFYGEGFSKTHTKGD